VAVHEAAGGWVEPLAHASAVVLVLLLPLHVVTLLIHPQETDAGTLIERWDSHAWLLADWSLLAVASVHALSVLWLRVEGAPWTPVVKTRVIAAVGGAGVALFLAASWSMLVLV
jgi:succinate dehydrogenase hydrophobic anchor subunit